MQEELKSARDGWRAASDSIDAEKARTQAREQEAFTARYQLVDLESKLNEALERIKVIEQERDAFKTLAKEEEVARIAAEGRIPLPKFGTHDDEFASPRKKQRTSLTTAVVTSSAASEEEVEELSRQVDWERQRADRAHEMIEFLHAECELRTCQAAKYLKRQSILSPRRVLVAPQELGPGDLAILGQAPSAPSSRPTSRDSEKNLEVPGNDRPSLKRKSRDEGRRSTIFCAREGIFRTVSQQEAEALEAAEKQQEAPEEEHPEMRRESEGHSQSEEEHNEPATPTDATPEHRMYARTPSVEPPTFALLAQERMSLASLLNAPQGGGHAVDIPEMNIPTMPDTLQKVQEVEVEIEAADEEQYPSPQVEEHIKEQSTSPRESPPRAGSNSGFYRTSTTTTSVPIHEDDAPRPISRFERARTPSGDSQASFDINNPAMTPTCTREEALARIRERRGRARSAAQGAATPRRPILQGGGERRDMSAPTVTNASSVKKAASKVRRAR